MTDEPKNSARKKQAKKTVRKVTTGAAGGRFHE